MTTRGRGTVRECPVTHAGAPCKAYVAPGRLCCVFHWRKVHPDLRTRYWQAWGRWNETHQDTDWVAFTAARVAVLTAVNS